MIHRYGEKGLQIIACPSNDFFQERGTNEDIQKFAAEQGAKFPVFGKLSLTHPLFQYLTSALPDNQSKVAWNFAKFLCDKNGVLVKRYAHTVPPLSIEPDILALLNKEED